MISVLRRTIVGVFAVLCLSGPAHAVTVIGAGANKSCGSWLAHRAARDITGMGNWALGFISGAGVYGRLDPLKGMNTDAVTYWLDYYCQAHPTDALNSAVDAFIADRGCRQREKRHEHRIHQPRNAAKHGAARPRHASHAARRQPPSVRNTEVLDDLQRSIINQAEHDTVTQQQIDALLERVERLEEQNAGKTKGH
jgi:hypothetical protein